MSGQFRFPAPDLAVEILTIPTFAPDQKAPSPALAGEGVGGGGWSASHPTTPDKKAPSPALAGEGVGGGGSATAKADQFVNRPVRP